MMLLRFVTLLVPLIFHSVLHGYGISNLSRNDPFPIFSTKEPYSFLTNHEKWNILAQDNILPERLLASVSVFRQAADKARNFDKDRVELGDINGKWNMLALTYDPTTACISETIASFTMLGDRPDLMPQFTANEIETITSECIPILIDPCNTDTNEKLGFFTVPAKYRKLGVRFDFEMQLCQDIGLSFVLGVADIKNQPCDFLQECPDTVTCLTLSENGTTSETCTLFAVNCTCLRYVDLELMRKLRKIANELDLDIDDFQKTGIDDVRLGAYWRHIFVTGGNCDDGFRSTEKRADFHPCCLFIPFVSFEGAIPFADQRDPRRIFSVPFDNNGHGAVGFTSGFNFVYHTWIEFGSEIGYTHFFPREVCNLPFPTQELQAGLIPFSVDACIDPGNNWHFGATLTTPYFIPHLSFYAQYLFVNHNPDQVTILRDLRSETVRACAAANDLELPPFLVKKFERESKFDFQLVNVAFNYEFCPEIVAGVFWQLPLRGRNVFRSTTVLFSLMGIF